MSWSETYKDQRPKAVELYGQAKELIAGGVVALMKPFSMETLAQVLDEALATTIDARRTDSSGPAQ